MTQITIALSDQAQAYLEEQLARGIYATADELITALILAEKQRQGKQVLNAMIREGLNSGEPIAVTDGWWETQREQMLQEAIGE
ncbi:MAG: hypothetical protein B0A82_03280 [Alkalinema sp. CACIAM 70d]|nr:MAG: hypothetical protein B0A82_03280 [Alkalinema sp. CACIAM 70d]